MTTPLPETNHALSFGRRRQALRLGCGCAVIALAAFFFTPARADYAARPEVIEYIDGLVAEHEFDRAWLAELFAGAAKSESVIEKISTPAEKVLAWHEYRAIFVTDKRIAAGVDFWRRNKDAIDAASREFGVSGEIVVAIVGVETFYGRYLGNHRVIDALATLAFDYPRRSVFFKRELTEFLLLVREEDKDPFAPVGSYAGAMGYGQFISSSYRNFAVDFDGDGQRDIWSNQTDAIGSIANYLARHGWRGTTRVAVRVEIANDGVPELADTGLDLAHTVGDFRKRGAVVASELADSEKAALFRMEAKAGGEYWLGLHDFYVITRYNHSAMYALAVLQLAQEIQRQMIAGNE